MDKSVKETINEMEQIHKELQALREEIETNILLHELWRLEMLKWKYPKNNLSDK